MASGEAMDVRVVEMIEQDEDPETVWLTPEQWRQRYLLADKAEQLEIAGQAIEQRVYFTLREDEAANKANDPS